MSRKNQVVFIGRVFVMVGIVLAVVSISLLLAGRADPDAVITQGTVVDQVPHLDGRTYYMVVEYTDESTGESHEVVSNYSTNRPAEVGSQVPVEYVPGEVGSARVATWASK